MKEQHSPPIPASVTELFDRRVQREIESRKAYPNPMEREGLMVDMDGMTAEETLSALREVLHHPDRFDIEEIDTILAFGHLIALRPYLPRFLQLIAAHVIAVEADRRAA